MTSIRKFIKLDRQGDRLFLRCSAVTCLLRKLVTYTSGINKAVGPNFLRIYLASIRKLVRDTLAPLGYNILEATNGEEALISYRENKDTVDLLLTDVVMPKMTGKKLAEILLTEYPGLKVLYMSGYTDNVVALQGVLDRGINFLNKPLVPSILTKKIREVLEK